MKKIKMKTLSLTMLAAGLLIGLTISAFSANASEANKYKINKNGDTYGSMDLSASPKEMTYPDLIYATGIDGTQGYVYKTDLDGEQPKNPEEALVYMSKLEEKIQIARSSGSEYLRYIPLYEEDGKTVIGEFGISYPW